jgi:hypothetical protein
MRLLLLFVICCALLAGCAKPLAPIASLDPYPVALRPPTLPTLHPAPAPIGQPTATAVVTAAARRTALLRDVYRRAYEEMAAMLAGKLPISFKRAVFVTENAYLGDSLDYVVFDRYVQKLAQICRNIQHVNSANLVYDKQDRENVARNVGVWQVMTDTVFLDRKDKSRYLPPYTYDFDDFDGAQDWRQMFVTKLMLTHRGNCHSMPILYKLLAEEVGAPCWLALAPNHIYLKQRNEQTGWYNSELTAHAFPRDAWLTASGYESRETIVSGLYLDTLGPRQNIALCLVDLANGYRRYFASTADEAFVRRCVTLALENFPVYVNALLLDAESQRRLFEAAPNPTTATAMEAAYARVVDTGYREMPANQYADWLRALQVERTKHQTPPGR